MRLRGEKVREVEGCGIGSGGVSRGAEKGADYVTEMVGYGEEDSKACEIGVRKQGRYSGKSPRGSISRKVYSRAPWGLR